MGALTSSWFDALVKEHPDAEQYRAYVTAVYAYVESADKDFHELSDAHDALKAKFEEIEGQPTDEQLRGYVEFLEKRLNGREAKQEFYLQFVVSLFDKASAYSNLIISAGFVGLFATWNLMKHALSSTENRMVAASALFSLLVFVAWEITKMVHAGVTSSSLSKILMATNDEDFNARQMKFATYGGRWQRFFEAGWKWILIATIVPGLFAGALLLAAFLDGIFYR